MKRHQGLFVLASLALAALLAGCLGDKSTSVELTTAPATNVGDGTCTQCHSAVLDPLTLQSIVTQYERSSPHKDSPYANNGNGCEACHGSGSEHYGSGPIPYPNPYENNGERCADCHNGEYKADAPTTFQYSRHVEEMTVEEGNTCRRCHSHEGAVLSNIAGYTGHYEILENTVNQGRVPLTQKYSVFRCSTCHEHGAGLRIVMATDNNGNLANWNPDRNQEPGQFDLCTSCHNMYDYTGTRLLAAGTPADNATGKPATDKAGHHETSWYRLIATTHYDNPATGMYDNGANLPAGNVVEGYVLRTNTANPCFDCHGHEANTGTRYGRTTTPTIYADWAQSGHAGGLLKAKYAAADNLTKKNKDRTTTQVDSVMISGIADNESIVENIGGLGTLTRATSNGIAWSRYQWEKTLKADGTPDRGTCQRCHTATGASNYLKDPAKYDYRNNDFSHLSGWLKASRASTGPATVASPQQEVLYCWGCHKNAAKALLYEPGPITAMYTGVSPEPVFPDSAASNICLACHIGVESGDSVKANTGNFDNLSFVNSHYLTAGATLFGVSGYQYAGRDYTIPPTDTHDKIGRGLTGNATVDTNYRNGPCVGCHMDSRNQANLNLKRSHTFSNYTQYADNDLALNPVCVNCHTTRGQGSNSAVTWIGDDATAATLQGTTHKARYQAALEALDVQLAAKGFVFTTGYPYFANKNWLSPGDTDKTGNTTGKNNMGAAFNYNLMIHDPGGVAHNRRYTRRLIYDSIDWLDDGTLNYSVSTTLNALDNSTVYKASAISYLLQAQNGNAGDRY